MNYLLYSFKNMNPRYWRKSKLSLIETKKMNIKSVFFICDLRYSVSTIARIWIKCFIFGCISSWAFSAVILVFFLFSYYQNFGKSIFFYKKGVFLIILIISDFLSLNIAIIQFWWKGGLLSSYLNCFVNCYNFNIA